jgi:hypothetical protein
MLRHWGRIGWASALCLAVTTPGSAETPMDIGILTCTLAESLVSGGPIDDSATTEQDRGMLCRFRPFREGPEETYLGTVRGLGDVRKLFNKRVVIWTVSGSITTQGSPGLLQQVYAIDAEASVDSALPLIGRTRTQLVLHPFADEEPPVPGKTVQPLGAIITTVELVLKSSPG